MNSLSRIRSFWNIENKYYIVQQMKIPLFGQHVTASEANFHLECSIFNKEKKINTENIIILCLKTKPRKTLKKVPLNFQLQYYY